MKNSEDILRYLENTIKQDDIQIWGPRGEEREEAEEDEKRKKGQKAHSKK